MFYACFEYMQYIHQRVHSVLLENDKSFHVFIALFNSYITDYALGGSETDHRSNKIQFSDIVHYTPNSNFSFSTLVRNHH